MIHTNRIVTVGEQESIIDRPIVLYRGDREVEIEFTLVGNEFTFSEEGNVIKSVNASHGQLVLNTPSGEHMFSELAECHEGKVVFVVTKEMIDEFVEMGFYSFQIRLYDSAEMKSRVTIPPVLNGFDIRNPIAAEDEANVVDQGLVDYARIFKDQSNEELPTFDWTGAYNKTEWEHHDVITENKMNKIEDALYSINTNIKESDVFMLNALDNVKKDADKYVKEHMAEVEADVDEFERNLNTDVQQFKIDTNASVEQFKRDTNASVDQFKRDTNAIVDQFKIDTNASVDQFKIDTNAAMTAHKNEVSEVVDGFDAQLADIEEEINTKAKTDTVISNLYNTEGFVNKILDVCQTYTDNFDKLVYGNIYTAWDDTVQTVNGKYELDCSSFINLLIHGVTFYNSRYNGKGDNITNPLFFNNIDSYEYRLANQIAKYCVENGYAFVPKSLDEIRAGDIVFYSWGDFETDPSKYTQAQIDYHNNAFMKIDHVAMYLDRKNDTFHHTIQYEQYTPQFLFTVSEEYMNQAVLVARLPFANIQENDTRDIIVNGNVKKTCTNSITIGTYYLSKKLEKGKLYSLAINGQINTDNCYYIVRDDQGSTIYSDYGRQHNFSGTMIAYFLYQGEGTDKISILIGSSDTSITQRNGYVNWCSLYEGYKLTISTKQGTSISNIRELQLIRSIQNNFLEGYAYTNNLVEYDTHYLVTLNLSVNDGFTASSVEIGNFDKLPKTQRIPCILISNNGAVISGAIQFGYDGIVRVIKYNNTDTWRHAIASGIIIK